MATLKKRLQLLERHALPHAPKPIIIQYVDPWPKHPEDPYRVVLEIELREGVDIGAIWQTVGDEF